MRTVPKSAKKYLSKVSAEGSVAAVAVVRSNADLSDESPGCIRPCTQELEAVDALVRKVGEEAVPLLTSPPPRSSRPRGARRA